MNKKIFFKFFSLLLILTFSTGFKVFANENNSTSSETLENIEILEDNETTFKTKAIFSSGRVEIVTINKINDKVLVEENNEKLAEYNANEIIKVTNEDNNRIRAKRDAGSWYQVSSWPRTNVEADYKRVSAVLSFLSLQVKLLHLLFCSLLQRLF